MFFKMKVEEGPIDLTPEYTDSYFTPWKLDYGLESASTAVVTTCKIKSTTFGRNEYIQDFISFILIRPVRF
jgi:hypothetical protein